MINLFKRLGAKAAERPRSTSCTFEQLYGPTMPQKSKYPVRPPESADDDVEQFYRDTEWLQPALNRSSPEGFRFHEVNSPYVSLGTYDEPEDGRTFEVSFGSLIVGEIAVVPNYFRHTNENDWADLRVRLRYPIEMIDGQTVHFFLTSLIKLTQAFEIDTYEAIQDDPRASTRASQSMAEAMWDRMQYPNNSLVIELKVAGPWTKFKDNVAHWKKNGVNPWDKWERKSDDED